VKRARLTLRRPLDDPPDPPMRTSRTPTPEADASEKRPRGQFGALVALMLAVAGVTTAAWVFALVVLAGWLISGVV
jgi:hypothetical protein